MTRAALLALALAAACSPAKNTPQTGSQTNWLLVCDSSDDCGGLECLCGTCTTSCESDAACSELAGASCVAPSDEGSIALCGGRMTDSSLCLARCDEACPDGTHCVADVCAPIAVPTVRVTLDTTMRHQTLEGFGASLAYADDAIVAHPDKAALYDLVFDEAGLDVLRMRNRYDGEASGGALEPAVEIISAAAQRLGRMPLVFMTSASPPAELKANASRACADGPQTCKLASVPAGGFDYAGFAMFWRDSLEAYASAGIVPSYVSIQNDPDVLPPLGTPNEACHFLPEEGTASVTIDGAQLDVEYPGYREALEAVRDAIAGLPDVPRLAAPETTGVLDISEYAPPLGASYDALAIHLYGQLAATVNVAALESVRDMAAQLGRPVLQTEMQADGFETAVLMHYALTAADAAAYLQNDLVSLTSKMASVALVLLNDDGLEIQLPYYAMMHFAKHTDPGWARVSATGDSTELLASAWLAPDERALTIVLVNAQTTDVQAEIVIPDTLRSQLVRSEVTRTVFDGVERAAVLGALSEERVVHVPARSIMTIALAAD